MQFGFAIIPRCPIDILGIDFRNDQRDIGVHPKSGGVIDHDRSRALRDRRELFRRPSAGAEKSEVDARERIFHRARRLADPRRGTRVFFRRNAARPASRRSATGKFAPFQHAKQLDSDRAGRADDRDVIVFRASRAQSIARLVRCKRPSRSSESPSPTSASICLAATAVLASYPVSTSRFGLGSEEGSLKTPLGRFRIGEKIGARFPDRDDLSRPRPTRARTTRYRRPKI